MGSSAISARWSSAELCRNATTGQGLELLELLVRVQSRVSPSVTDPGQVRVKSSVLTVTPASPASAALVAVMV